MTLMYYMHSNYMELNKTLEFLFMINFVIVAERKIQNECYNNGTTTDQTCVLNMN